MPSATEAAAGTEAVATRRISTLDLIRGVAVLGILAINIRGFAGPMAATYGPHAVLPPDPAGDAMFAISLFLFEGKMRALFSLLFGAGVALFIDRTEAAGGNGSLLQLRRLLWLGVFGYLHYLLFWWGDILFIYALGGIIVLMLHQLPRPALLAAALVMFTTWQAEGTLRTLPSAIAEVQFAQGSASPETRAAVQAAQAARLKADEREIAGYRQGLAEQASRKLREDPLFPMRLAMGALGETVPLMLIGFVLYQWGFFTLWRRAWLVAAALGGIGLGGALSAGFAWWAWTHGFPYRAMITAINYALGFPHLLMALGYGALLVLAAPALVATWPGRRLVAAGRMAFSNYIATTIVMTGLFYGWGLGLMGHVPGSALPLFVLLGWALMLGWSAPWLARFRQGPLEWLWRSLAGRRVAGFRGTVG